MSTVEIDVVTINIPVQVGLKSWVSCWKKASSKGTVFGTQETFSRGQKTVYKKLCKKYNWGRAGMSGPNPVFFDKRVWTKLSSHVIKLHDADTGRHTQSRPGFHSARFMTEVVLHNIQNDYEAVVLNLHWVPQQFVTRSFRFKSRRVSKKILRRRVRYHTALGRVVIVMGDTNIYKRLKIASVRWLRGVGIDKLGVAVPSRMTIESMAHGFFKAPTDHKHGIKGSVRINKS